MPSKFPQKISQIVVPAFQTDFRHRQIRLLQQPEGLFDAVLVDIGYGGTADGFFKQAAEILFIQIYLTGQIGDIDSVPVMISDVGEGGFDTFHTLVEVFLRGRKKPVGGEGGEYIEQGRFDIKLARQIVRNQRAVGNRILRHLPEGVHDVQKGFLERGKCGVFGRDIARKEQLSVLDRLYQMNLCLVIRIETEDAGGEDHGVLPVTVGGFRDDTVQLAGIDEVEAFRVRGKGVHIDFETKFSAGKIQNLRFFMPVMFDERAPSRRVGAVCGTGKGLRSVRPDFLKNG